MHPTPSGAAGHPPGSRPPLGCQRTRRTRLRQEGRAKLGRRWWWGATKPTPRVAIRGVRPIAAYLNHGLRAGTPPGRTEPLAGLLRAGEATEEEPSRRSPLRGSAGAERWCGARRQPERWRLGGALRGSATHRTPNCPHRSRGFSLVYPPKESPKNKSPNCHPPSLECSPRGGRRKLSSLPACLLLFNATSSLPPHPFLSSSC